MSNETVKESYADRVAKIRALKADEVLNTAKGLEDKQLYPYKAVDMSGLTDIMRGEESPEDKVYRKLKGEAQMNGKMSNIDYGKDMISSAYDTGAYQDYQKKVIDEITRLTEPPYTTQVIGGIEVKVYPANYFNSDYIALKWFCESVHFDKEICDELLFNKNGNEFRVSVTNVGLATLAHWRCK